VFSFRIRELSLVKIWAVFSFRTGELSLVDLVIE